MRKIVGYKISKLQSKSNLPFDLLLLADETIEAIEKYIYDSEVYIVRENECQDVIGVFVLYKIGGTEIEIKNIAVSEEHQGKGIGSYLLNEIKQMAIQSGVKNIIVGTPGGSIRQIHFYERNGFKRYAVKKDFFIENYTEPIVENGTRLKDMVMLKIEV